METVEGIVFYYALDKILCRRGLSLFELVVIEVIYIVVVLLFAGFVTAYIVSILIDADLNRQLSSSIRATSASFFSLATPLTYIPLALAFAWVSHQYSIATAFGAVGMAVLVWLAFTWLLRFG